MFLLPNFVEEINSIDEKIALIDLVCTAARLNLISDMSVTPSGEA